MCGHFDALVRLDSPRKDPAIKSKITNPGVSVLYLGHAEDHMGDVHRLLNMETKRVVFSRDV